MKNNFDFLRLVFSIFVIITHSFVLSGNKEWDYLCVLTGQNILLSAIGVKGFFIISGYLIYKSIIRSNSLKQFYWNRLLRIVPALFIVVFLSVLFGSLLYNSPIPYLQNTAVWTYIPVNISLFMNQYYIPGIFEHNPYKGSINGSLWTIPYEFKMYILCSLIFFIKNKLSSIRILLIGVFIISFLINVLYFQQFKNLGTYASGILISDFICMFSAGSLLAALNIDQVKHLSIMSLLTFILLIVSIVTHTFEYAHYLLLPLLVISFGLLSTPIISSIGSYIGDVSYGIYLYGFPVQQILMSFQTFNQLELMIYSLVISIILAFLSWHIIEKNALRLKNIF